MEREKESHEMATNLASCYHADDEEEYIDMEVSSSKLLFGSTNSPPQTREFEFQMSFNSHQKQSTTSPADELFYKGKLLPLHLPPRLQMVQKLLQTTTTATAAFDNTKHNLRDDRFYSIAFITTSTTSSTNTSTPLESCNISPSESCRVSSELNPDEYYFEWSTELANFVADQPKKSWSKKLKLMKQTSLTQKLKSSRAYLKSLFNKSACSEESSAKEGRNFESSYVSKGKEYLNKYKKVAKKNPFGQIGKGTYPTLAHVISNSIDKEEVEDGTVNTHRRSFSGAIKRHSATKSSSSSGTSSSSSSFSFNSNGSSESQSQFLKRSSSANEIESSIEGAIAHCKKSSAVFSSRIAVAGDKETPGFCSI